MRACFFGFVLLIEPSAGDATTILVMQDGSGNATTISGGVSLAVAGDSVVVGPGVYPEQVTIEDSLTLVSMNGAGATTIDASGAAYSVGSTMEVIPLVLEGFTLQGAEPAAEKDIAFAVNGKGDITIRNCIFTEGPGSMNALFWEGN